MDACEIANFLATELFMQQLVSFDGIHSGVPTQTTATLTPTTLRNIHQTFIELANEPQTAIPCQAGFVPPLAPFSFEQDQDQSLSSQSGSLSNSSWQTPPPSTTDDLNSTSTIINNAQSNNSSTPRRNMGGRRPTKSSNLSPEEEEKRKVRRERNKLAAARCRKRRVDHTNELVDEVEGLEKKKQNLQTEIQQLQHEKEDLEFILEGHRVHCRLQNNNNNNSINNNRSQSPPEIKPNTQIILPLVNKVKIEPLDLDGPPSPKRIMLSSAANDIVTPPATTSPTNLTSNNLLHAPTLPLTKPNRPSSLNVPLTMTPSQALAMSKSGNNLSDFIGVPIQTPSTGMFNFDSLMEGGTGLTPVAGPLMPTCSTQNRNPLELTTPTSEPSKLVSL